MKNKGKKEEGKRKITESIELRANSFNSIVKNHYWREI